MKSLTRTSPRCLAMNSVGLRCGLDALPDSDRCSLHQESATEFEEDLTDTFLNAQEFADNVLQSWEFREYIISGLKTGKIPQSIILRFMDYAEGWGRPPERIEHTGKDGDIITEVRRVVIHNRDESSAPPKDSTREETLELQGEDLDIPMLPVPPRRMH